MKMTFYKHEALRLVLQVLLISDSSLTAPELKDDHQNSSVSSPQISTANLNAAAFLDDTLSNGNFGIHIETSHGVDLSAGSDRNVSGVNINDSTFWMNRSSANHPSSSNDSYPNDAAASWDRSGTISTFNPSSFKITENPLPKPRMGNSIGMESLVPDNSSAIDSQSNKVWQTITASVTNSRPVALATTPSYTTSYRLLIKNKNSMTVILHSQAWDRTWGFLILFSGVIMLVIIFAIFFLARRRVGYRKIDTASDVQIATTDVDYGPYEYIYKHNATSVTTGTDEYENTFVGVSIPLLQDVSVV